MTGACKAILLDIDGTLIDSNDAHARAWVDSLAEAGFEVSHDRARRLIGKGGDKVLPELTGLSDESAKGKEIAKRRGQIFKEKYLATVRPFDKSRELLQRMKREGYTLVVATSAREEELDALLRIAHVEDLVDARTTSSDAENSKPDPDIIQVALTRAGCGPDEAIMLGDTPYDVASAARAKVRAIAVRCGGWSDPDLQGAVAIYEDPSQLLRDFDASPLVSR